MTKAQSIGTRSGPVRRAILSEAMYVVRGVAFAPLGKLESTFKALENAGCHELHFDVRDGVFASPHRSRPRLCRDGQVVLRVTLRRSPDGRETGYTDAELRWCWV